MFSASKLLMGIGALGATGLAAWGVYHASISKTIQDKLSREGLKILNLDKGSDVDKDAWKRKIEDYREFNRTQNNQTNLKISGLELLGTGDIEEVENIKKFKDKCSEILLTSLGTEDVNLKEKQARIWCVEEIQLETTSVNANNR